MCYFHSNYTALANRLPTMTCFIVDDDEDDREFFAAAIDKLSFQSFTFIYAVDGADALEQLDNELRPDYIFLDLNMPRIDGIQCLTEIRKRTHLKDIPVAIYTTSADSAIQSQALHLGASSFLTKPNTFDEMVNKLKIFFTTHGFSKGDQHAGK